MDTNGTQLFIPKFFATFAAYMIMYLGVMFSHRKLMQIPLLLYCREISCSIYLVQAITLQLKVNSLLSYLSLRF